MKKYLLILVSLVCYSATIAQQGFLDSLQLKTVVNNDCTSVKDQYLSATCWSFASNSFIESELIKKGVRSIDLSEMFIARYSYTRKISMHLALKGSNFFTPGGQFHDVQWVIKNYGMMPEDAYSGKPGREKNHDHGSLDTLIKRFVERKIMAGQTTLTAADNAYINELMNDYLGQLPASFMYKGKKYTPKSFAANQLHFKEEDYVELTSYTHHPFYTSFVLEDKYNWTGDKYFNLPVGEFEMTIDTALKNGYTIGWDGDTQEPGFDYNNGIAYMPYDFPDLQTERQVGFEDKTTAIDHMMHIVGYATDKDGNKWYRVKNSWGSSNVIGGYIYMDRKYLLTKTSAVIVNKAAIPAAILKKTKP